VSWYADEERKNLNLEICIRGVKNEDIPAKSGAPKGPRFFFEKSV